MKQTVSKIPWLSCYIGVIAGLGLLILYHASFNLPADKVGLSIFIGLAVVAELGSVELFRGSRNSSVSVSMIVAIAGVLYFGPTGAALIYAVSGLMTVVTMSLLHRHKPARKNTSWLTRSSFNIGMFAISAFCAGWIYIWFGGSVGDVSRFSNVFPCIAAVTAIVLINLTILIGIISLQTRRSALEIWREDIAWGVPINIIGAIIGGAALALAYESTGVLGLLVFFVPVLSIGYSFRLYVSHMKEYVNKLEEMNVSLDKANLGLLETLGAVVDAYDEFTYRHSYQVAVYGSALAHKIGLSKEECADIHRAALIHDIGKIGVLDSIVSKPGALTEDEYSLIKRHPVIGANIIRSMEGLQNLIPLVRSHHEKWDGTGYPAGLAGEEIPCGARILALADSLDAMCSARPYREPLDIGKVKLEISSLAGKQFDPKVVEAFFAILDQRGDSFIEKFVSGVNPSAVNGQFSPISQGVRYLKKSMVIEKNP